MNIENIKKTLSLYTKKEVHQIDENTLIDQATINSSLLFHRMYEELRQHGLSIEKRFEIKTFGDLLNAQNSVSDREDAIKKESKREVKLEFDDDNNGAIGIDIESINNFPVVDDYRNHEFYRKTFTAREISYCITRKNPVESFAGKFAAKEALKKIDSNLMQKEFKEIEILNSENGKPFIPGYSISISISHSNGLVVAAAFRQRAYKYKPIIREDDSKEKIKLSRFRNLDLFYLSVILLLIVYDIFIYDFFHIFN